MSKEGTNIAKRLQKKYSEAENIITQSDRKYFDLFSASDKLRLATYLVDMCFTLAASNGRKTLKEFRDAIEIDRKEKTRSYQQMIRWMREKQEKSQ